MALRKKKEKVFRFISVEDDALTEKGGLSIPESHAAYVENNCDESFLQFVEGRQPTRFVFKIEMSFKQQSMLFDSIKMRDGKTEMLQSTALEILRSSLIDLEVPADAGPEDPRFSKDDDGFASMALMDILSESGEIVEVMRVKAALSKTSPLASSDLKKS